MFCTVLCGVRSESHHGVLVQSSHLLGNNSTSSLTGTAGVFESFSAMLLPSDPQLHRSATSDVCRFSLYGAPALVQMKLKTDS